MVSVPGYSGTFSRCGSIKWVQQAELHTMSGLAHRATSLTARTCTPCNFAHCADLHTVQLRSLRGLTHRATSLTARTYTPCNFAHSTGILFYSSTWLERTILHEQKTLAPNGNRTRVGSQTSRTTYQCAIRAVRGIGRKRLKSGSPHLAPVLRGTPAWVLAATERKVDTNLEREDGVNTPLDPSCLS